MVTSSALCFIGCWGVVSHLITDVVVRFLSFVSFYNKKKIIRLAYYTYLSFLFFVLVVFARSYRILHVRFLVHSSRWIGDCNLLSFALQHQVLHHRVRVVLGFCLHISRLSHTEDTSYLDPEGDAWLTSGYIPRRLMRMSELAGCLSEFESSYVGCLFNWWIFLNSIIRICII